MFALFHHYATAVNTIAKRPAYQGRLFEKADKAGFTGNCWMNQGHGVIMTVG
jgi:hypothetical protein